MIQFQRCVIEAQVFLSLKRQTDHCRRGLLGDEDVEVLRAGPGGIKAAQQKNVLVEEIRVEDHQIVVRKVEELLLASRFALRDQRSFRRPELRREGPFLGSLLPPLIPGGVEIPVQLQGAVFRDPGTAGYVQLQLGSRLKAGLDTTDRKLFRADPAPARMNDEDAGFRCRFALRRESNRFPRQTGAEQRQEQPHPGRSAAAPATVLGNWETGEARVSNRRSVPFPPSNPPARTGLQQWHSNP